MIEQKKKYDIVIGVDPDNKKDGVAILEVATRRVLVYETTLGQTISMLQKYAMDCMVKRKSLMVYVEGGWLNTGNFHLKAHDSRAVIAAKGVDQGRNHQRGMDIVELCEYHQIPHEVIKPLPKVSGRIHLWNGPDGKITQSEIEAIMGKLRTTGNDGKKKRINQEARDAALIAWWMAGLPINTNKTFKLI